ncbi:uncharacterized protein LOC116301636 [Actinia tenebrosa]|uniref:Uncharacterized protein LOC116301636 n=1 Tax=Actinia tenebrosa TaxID=6105 RepID=A0A6P8II78_ACTTE|nr:uncharacterized protein LOC116301636 [Actinia tenebrosa]
MSLSLFLSVSRRQSSIVKHLQRFHAAKISRRTAVLGYYREKSYQAFQESHQDELFSPLDPCELAPKRKYPLAGIKYLPGSDGKGFPEFLANPRQGLPQAYKIQHADQFSISEWAQHCRKLLDEQLPKYGVVLFRGLPLSTGEHFSLFSNALGYTAMGYDGGTGERPTFDQEAQIYVSTLEDKANNMEPHNEMSYLPVYPRKVIFHCNVPPEAGCGGVTPITRNSEILELLDPKIVQKFEEKQVCYIRTQPDGIKSYLPTWQDSFRTDDRKRVEKVLEKIKSTYKWNQDGSLCYRYNLPATIYHPQTGEKVWFNQACAHHCTYLKNSPMFDGVIFESDSHYPTHTTYGDGTEIEPEVLQYIREIGWKCTVGFEWEKSDTLVLDNLKARHGRLSYTGERRLLVYMSSD